MPSSGLIYTNNPSLHPASGSFSAVVEASGSAWRIDRQAFEQMATKDAFSLALLQQVVLRSTCLSAAHAREALERASHAN